MENRCAIQGCNKEKQTRGWCSKHYGRWKAHGDPEFTHRPNLVRAHVKTRFWSKVALPNENGCMLWLDSTDKDGYGVFTQKGKQLRVHRLAYELMAGPIPEGKVLDHVKAWGCISKKCCAPNHLEVVTVAENTRRSGAWEHNANKTHCKHGHQFNEQNTAYVQGKSGIQRHCRVCDRDKRRKGTSKFKQYKCGGCELVSTNSGIKAHQRSSKHEGLEDV